MVLRQVCAVSSAVAVISFLLACHPDSNQAIEVATPYLNQAIEVATPYLNHALAWTSSSQAAVMAAPYIDDAVAWISRFQEVWNEKTSIAEKAAVQKAAAEKAAAEKAAAEKAAAEGRASMTSNMYNFFSGITINRKDSDEAERLLRGDLVEKWDEKIFNKVTIGIEVDKFEDYLGRMSKRFNITDLKEQFLEITYSESTEEKVWKFGFDNDLSSLFGFVSFKKDYRGKIDAVYAIHSLRAKMADKRITTTKTKWALWVIPLESETSVEREPVKFGTKDIDKIRNQYFMKRALEAFKDYGLLEEIKYS